MFIRKQPSSKNRWSHSILESYWAKGKPRQRTLICLGPHASLEQAIADAHVRHTPERLEELLAFQRKYPWCR